jgi:hypothetical protein
MHGDYSRNIDLKWRVSMVPHSLEGALGLIIDDIQGTGAVTQAAVKSAVWAAKGKVAEQKIVIFGAGTAGTGTHFGG